MSFSDVKFIGWIAAAFVAAFAMVVVPLVFMENAYQRYQCDNYAKITDKETFYANFDECYVKTNSGFQRWDEYKARIIASERSKQ